MAETPIDGTPPPRPSGNRAARYLFMALLGLVTGVVATVMVTRALHERKDHYPESVMYVMQAHMAALKRNVSENRCAATDTLPHLNTLRHLANDFEPAFGGLREDAAFTRHASDMRATMDAALASPPLNCAGVQAAMGRIGEGCKACHDDYRQ
jgi:crotonobetainyl-CoA:carnitine CoA-transferase CaiB-like acyl-CoA transferase